MASIAVMCAGQASGREYFVSPGGSDAGAGTEEAPFATLEKAASVLKPGDICFLREGVYREVLRPAQSGTPEKWITFANYPGERAVISGADPLDEWTKEPGRVYSAPMPWSMPDGNQVFAAGRMLSEACWPDAGDDPLFNPARAAASGGSPNTLVGPLPGVEPVASPAALAAPNRWKPSRPFEEIPGDDDAWKGAQLWCAGGQEWICWTSIVAGYDADTRTLTFDEARDTWYTPKEGSLFVLRGARAALDAPGEWCYDADAKRLLLMPPEGADIGDLKVEAKRRLDALDLSGRSYIKVKGIEFRAAGIRTDEASSHIVLENLKGSYVSHGCAKDVGGTAGILVRGNNILALNCEFGYSSAAVVSVSGHDNRVINCNIHHGGYAGLWKGTVVLSGRRIVFSHNTVRHAGRDLINTHGLMESLVQYNDVSEAGWLTKDLGMFYGHNTDFANTEFRYNLVHDNRAKGLGSGIYFDHLSHNAIVHHNVVWNLSADPISLNNPGYCNLVFNNSAWNTHDLTTFDHAGRNDLFACRLFNNVFNGDIRLPAHVVTENNLLSATPPFRNPDAGDFRLTDPDMTGIGACPADAPMWRAGCDLRNPPNPLPVYEPPRIPWMNTIRNACFEFGTLEGWEKTNSAKAELVPGNGWGVNAAPLTSHATGTSRYELRLGPGRDGVRQIVKGLSPATEYTLSAWLRVSAPNENVVLGVKDHGNREVRVALSSTEWTRRSIVFTTGPKATEATVFLLKPSDGDGFASCDNLTLPLTAED